jgi:DNA-binding transcriptional ArsR family regulator
LKASADALAEKRLDDMRSQAQGASEFIKAMSHEGRLLILCHLAEGERSVSELEVRLGIRQAAVSQQLARLRADGLVAARRDGKTIHYSVSDPKVGRMIALIYDLFRKPS